MKNKAKELLKICVEDSDAEEMEHLKQYGFKPMEKHDFDGYGGADEGTWILHGDYYDILASPSGDGYLCLATGDGADEIGFNWESADIPAMKKSLDADKALEAAVGQVSNGEGTAEDEEILANARKNYAYGKGAAPSHSAQPAQPKHPSRPDPEGDIKWVLSVDGHALEKDFSYEDAKEATAKLQAIVKDHPGVEVTQLGYDDMSVVLPAGTNKTQALELAHRIAAALPFPSSKEWKHDYGDDVLGDLHTFDSHGAVEDMVHDGGDHIKVNKGDKMEAVTKAASLLGVVEGDKYAYAKNAHKVAQLHGEIEKKNKEAVKAVKKDKKSKAKKK